MNYRYKIFFLILLSVCVLGVRAGNIITDSLYSNVLSSWVKYNIYLPKNYNDKAGKYPIVYLLHGLSDDYSAWQTRGNMKILTDELIDSGEACEMLIVMPNAGGADIQNEWCGYFNMPGWSYENFFFDEFIVAVEKKYHGYGDKWHRAIMGLSMGGGGSVVYCQHHPELFSSCYAMSAWLDNKDNNVGGNPAVGSKLFYVCESVSKNSALKFVESADEQTKQNLRTVAWFFDCGDDDFLLEMNMKMHMIMRSASIQDEFRVRNGMHNWEYWHNSLRMALPFASRNFAK